MYLLQELNAGGAGADDGHGDPVRSLAVQEMSPAHTVSEADQEHAQHPKGGNCG